MAVQQRLTTIEEFEAFLADPEHSDQVFELINGEIIEKAPTEEHGIVMGNIYAPIWNHLRANNLNGRVVIEPRHGVPDDNINDRVPDIAYTSAERALPVTKQGAVPQMPDLAVEVQSPGQSQKFLLEKAAYYLANGAKMVWLVYPQKQIVEIITPDDRDLLTLEDTLDGGDVLPSFNLPVRDIFRIA